MTRHITQEEADALVMAGGEQAKLEGREEFLMYGLDSAPLYWARFYRSKEDDPSLGFFPYHVKVRDATQAEIAYAPRRNNDGSVRREL